jgi:hypothetical protein
MKKIKKSFIEISPKLFGTEEKVIFKNVGKKSIEIVGISPIIPRGRQLRSIEIYFVAQFIIPRKKNWKENATSVLKKLGC